MSSGGPSPSVCSPDLTTPLHLCQQLFCQPSSSNVKHVRIKGAQGQGSGHFLGQEASVRGGWAPFKPDWHADARRKPHIWHMDMIDIISCHLNNSMLALSLLAGGQNVWYVTETKNVLAVTISDF